MPSQFGWVDFAEQDRQRMLDVVRLFKERETRDELGIGTIRDAFADYFFPGTSTIQTRIRYMLFIPWIYLKLEQQKEPPHKIAEKARQREIYLISALMKGGETTDVIGSRAKAGLKRLPSSIYWAGLKAWGIRRFDGYQDQYHRSLGWFYRQQTSFLHQGERETTGQAAIANWDPGLPESPKDFLTKTTFDLTESEAHYLQDRIRFSHGQSLLAHLVNQQQIIPAPFFWEHPLADAVPESLQETIMHARNFSDTVFGAAILYNLLLARKREDIDLRDAYQEGFEIWADLIAARGTELNAWHKQLDAFWRCPALQLANIPSLTRAFVENWLGLIFTASPYTALADNQQAHILIQNREFQLKRTQARLENQRALELWNGSSGSYQLDYRWSTATRLANDIIKSLYPQEAANA